MNAQFPAVNLFSRFKNIAYVTSVSFRFFERLCVFRTIYATYYYFNRIALFRIYSSSTNTTIANVTIDTDTKLSFFSSTIVFP